MKPTFRNSQDAFNDAFKTGVLSPYPGKSNFGGNYMYMFTEHGRDQFKHIDTRAYVSSPAPIGDAVAERSPSFTDISWIDDNDGCGPRKLQNQVRCF